MNMIDFEKELKKYHPSLEIEESGDRLYNQDFTDIADIVVSLIADPKGTGRGNLPGGTGRRS